MQQFYRNVVDSKVFGYKIEISLTKWSFFATINAVIKSEVYFSVEINV